MHDCTAPVSFVAYVFEPDSVVVLVVVVGVGAAAADGVLFLVALGHVVCVPTLLASSLECLVETSGLISLAFVGVPLALHPLATCSFVRAIVVDHLFVA